MYIDPPYNTESSLTDGNNLSEKMMLVHQNLSIVINLVVLVD
ncbi:hypothetical protein HYD98_00825 [Mycoplasmopsis bovis]|nr:hypothetical protein HYD98_00825 [Mycoplasmopsis bovis]